MSLDDETLNAIRRQYARIWTDIIGEEPPAAFKSGGEGSEYIPVGLMTDDGIRVYADPNNDACCGCKKCARLCHGCNKCDPNNDRGNLHAPRY